MSNQFEIIIVLSNLMDKYGRLNLESKKRALKAFEIFKLNPNSIILTSGWNYRKDCNLSIAEAFKNHFVKFHKINPQKILCENNSRDTVGDAVFSRINIRKKFNFKSIAIVTSPYHRERANEIFNFIYGETANIKLFSYNSITEDPYIIEKEIISLKKFRKTFDGIKTGDIKNIYERLISNHPFYNGKIYEKLI